MKAASCQLCLCPGGGHRPCPSPRVAQRDALPQQPEPVGPNNHIQTSEPPQGPEPPNPQPEQGSRASPYIPPEPAALFGQSLSTKVLPRGNLSSFSLIQGQTHSVARGQSRTQPWSYEERAENTKPGADRCPGGLNPCQMPTRAVHHPPRDLSCPGPWLNHPGQV